MNNNKFKQYNEMRQIQCVIPDPRLINPNLNLSNQTQYYF